jgi:hypothetical protein
MRGASGIGMGTTIKHLRRTTSGAAGNGLGATMKYLQRTTSAAANNGMSITIIPLCSAASFEVNSKPHTGARPSVRLCVGPELARCAHSKQMSIEVLYMRYYQCAKLIATSAAFGIIVLKTELFYLIQRHERNEW